MERPKEPALAATARVMAAYLKRERVQAAALPSALREVRAAFSGRPAPPAPTRPGAANPYGLVRFDAVICADCGWRGKSLKRHLAADHGLTPETYRARWGLAPDHPIVSPEFSVRRSAMARASGLGRKGG